MRAATGGALLSIVLLSAAAPAFPQVFARTAPPVTQVTPPDERPIVARTMLRVPMKGVDLYSAKGIASFYRRLQRAAKAACDYGNIPGYYDKECAADALDRAVAGRGVRALDQLHAQKRGGAVKSRDPVVVRYVCGSDRPLGTC